LFSINKAKPQLSNSSKVRLAHGDTLKTSGAAFIGNNLLSPGGNQEELRKKLASVFSKKLNHTKYDQVGSIIKNNQ